MICNKCGQQAGPNEKFCRKCGTALIDFKNRKSTALKWLIKNKKTLLIIGGVIFLILIFLVKVSTNSSGTSNSSGSNVPAQSSQVDQGSSSFPATTTVDQSEIVSSVVNIWCPNGNSYSGGSGTLWTSQGLILTNAHIIPQDSNENPTPSHCLVTLPNAQGGIKDEYMGEPIIIPTISKKYDLAFIKIDGPYTDSYGVDHGPYPTTFPDYPDFGCRDDAVTLSEPVTVFGYPEISNNGNSLTITTGVASSLPGDGTIVTSAKVAHGDSGGLAVDEDGCMIGVPSMISSDKSESLGIIKDDPTVEAFLSDLQSYLNRADQTSNGQ